MSANVPCELFEMNGNRLATGLANFLTGAGAWEAVITRFDEPGRLVQRCLLGPVRDLRVIIAGREPIEAKVERVFYDPKLGRACALRGLAA